MEKLVIGAVCVTWFGLVGMLIWTELIRPKPLPRRPVSNRRMARLWVIDGGKDDHDGD